MTEERITRADVSNYKREILESSVLVTVEVAAEILSKSTKSVHRYLQEGRLTAYDPSGRVTNGVRIRAAELRDYVKNICVIYQD
jgi:hypothetical protein